MNGYEVMEVGKSEREKGGRNTVGDERESALQKDGNSKD